MEILLENIYKTFLIRILIHMYKTFLPGCRNGYTYFFADLPHGV
jgi:hypothetical protein